METNLIDRIAANPNPYRKQSWVVRFICWGKQLNRDAVIESGKIMFSLIGVGTVMANIVTAGRWFFAPVVVIFLGAWYGIYCQMEGVK